jgi:urease accessory protein
MDLAPNNLSVWHSSLAFGWYCARSDNAWQDIAGTMFAEENAIFINDTPQWQAYLQVEVERRCSGSRLTGCKHNGPLYVQKPFYPEGTDWPHIYVLHPPGGIVSGDELIIDVRVGEGSACLLTTPGAGRIYRARHDLPEQCQRVRLRVEPSASLEWFPMETIAFPGADVSLETRVQLDAGATCALWEITSLGLPASEEPFNHGRFEQYYRVDVDGGPAFIDRFLLDDHSRALLTASVGLRGHPVVGFLLMGPFSEPLDELSLANLYKSAKAGGFTCEAAISRVSSFYIGRYLGGSTERARKLFERWWTCLRPVLSGREACPPRIWLT